MLPDRPRLGATWEALAKMPDKIVVPPGHKVVVVYPAPRPQFSRLESGTLVANLTAAKESEGVFAAAWKQLSTDATATVL